VNPSPVRAMPESASLQRMRSWADTVTPSTPSLPSTPEGYRRDRAAETAARRLPPVVKAEMLRPYVEQVLKTHLGVDELVRDGDGDYPIRFGSAKYFVRLSDEQPPVVRVYSHVLVGVRGTAKLYQALNTINQHISFARVFHQGKAVLVATELLAETLDPEELVVACRSIANLADVHDGELKAAFGGETMFDDGGEGGEEV
jgi:hypothetical protein